jgi:ketosteroid isomerase-like protein
MRHCAPSVSRTGTFRTSTAPSRDLQQTQVGRDTSFLMSANLELVRSILAAWERGDFTSVEWAHPEIEYVAPDGPEPGSWTGLAEMSDAAAAGLGAWENFRIEVDECRKLDDERVLVFFHGSGQGRTSGVELGEIAPYSAYLFHVRNGKVTRLVFYMSRDRALADLGLASEADSSPS